MITSKDLRHFNAAAKLAELSTFRRVPVGCVVVHKNQIISTGSNKDKTDPLQKKYNGERNVPDYSPHKVHAEVDAIKHVMGFDVDWSAVSIFVYRKRRDQPHGMARPCKSCMKLIKDLGIRNVYYTTDEGFAQEVIE